MALDDIRPILLLALKHGHYGHVPRTDQEAKNWLFSGKVTRQFVANLLRTCAPSGYQYSPDYDLPKLMVHAFEVCLDGQEWYLKFVFIPAVGCRVYSVHPSTTQSHT